MKPVYARSGVTVYHGRLEDVLPEIDRVDVCLVDVPYGIGEAAGKNKSRSNLAVSKDYGDLDWDNEPLSASQMELILGSAKWHAIWGAQYYQMPATSCQLIWSKLNGRNSFADFETAWTNLKRANRMFEWMWNGFLRDSDEERVHPTQKPIEVMRWCLSLMPPGVKTVIDPCAGSFTTAIACIRNDLQFIGIESHEPYIVSGIKRIEDELNRHPLFDAVPAQQTCLFGE